ncbi:cellulase family glycosylhydrolase [Saccharothrix sp. ALI-22-I]|uniref:cellulase family glycosylhydrolase n=1 Tax=Saccharothrix sp. ALI-22-I TaxID=1933778 RepID=UPI001EE6B819|nr:cellulase family glycosylhydrolase [Saccharothrix sp. ALI-22-I]
MATAPALADPLPAASHVPGTAQAVVAAMQPSWNLGNSLDAIPNETAWGNPPATKALFDAVRAKGFRSVRIPVTWSNAQSTTAPYTIDPAYLTRVKQVVDFALADGLYVVLNVHHDSWQWISKMADDHDTVRARFDATWRQIATTFRDAPRRLLFESVNEPAFDNATDAQKKQYMDELNTSFHTLVRASGGGNTTRVLVLPTLGCTPGQTLMEDLAATIAGLHDPNIAATVHFYGFWPFSVNIAGFTRFEETSRKDLLDTFARMRDIFVAKGIPVYLGEYGLLSHPDYTKPAAPVERGEVLKYFELLGYQARISGVTTALWDAGSFINRNTLQWREQGLMDLIRASWRSRSGTASSDQVFVPRSSPITDHTLTLDLNGTTFRGLWHGDTRLASGRDYTVSGDRLTLTSAALTRLVGSRAYGVNASLQARFSAGAPWPIDVITHDLPAQTDTTGTTDSFAIPTQFRGDVLATMQARYADGSNAGTATWTPYQEFHQTFYPKYADGTLVLTPAFLNALTDGAPVTLTFDFWSGAAITYHVTRTGTTVTGTIS